MLTVLDQRRGRSKSPGRRERSTSRDHRDHSHDSRAKSPSRREHKNSNKKHSESEPEDDGRQHREKKSHKKHYDSGSEDRRSKPKKRHSASEGEESDRRRKSTSKKYHDSDSDDQGKLYRSRKRWSHRHEPEASETDHHREKGKKSSKKYYGSDGYENSPERHLSHAPDWLNEKSKEKHYDYENGRHPSYAQPQQYVYAQPAQFAQIAPGEAVPTRHTSYGDASDELWRDQWAAVAPSQPYSAPDAFPISPQTGSPDYHRALPMNSPGEGNYFQPAQYQYAEVDPNIKYKSKSEQPYSQNPQQTHGMLQYTQTAHPQYVDLKPGSGKDDRYEKRHRHEEPQSKAELVSRLGRLSIPEASTAGAGSLLANPDYGDGARPPPSPLLEAYRGTYQSISPMPSPTILAKTKHNDSDPSDLSDLDLSTRRSKLKKSDKNKDRKVQPAHKHHRSSNASTTGPDAMVVHSPRTPKRVSFYDPTPDAQQIAFALSGTHHTPNVEPLITILPALSTEDILVLRTEYKNHAKTSGRGINMAKHIKMRVPGNLGKAAYTTALGRWESEAYWANSWYQSGGSRRELLIESLMGRSNSDIREIKNCFKDKRYHDDLEKCMSTELKADKFRMAILLVLEESRMSDSAALDDGLIARDVEDLYRALTSRDGGETAMIQIIVLRSDAHLLATLRAFEKTYRLNFAREMIDKSRNLVGETLAHILNGALNRPMRDALLLHQAIAETAPGKERAELLISRAVRLHWDARHMRKVLSVYRERYGVNVGEMLATQVWSTMKTVEGREWVEFVAGCLGVEVEDYVRRDRRASGAGWEHRHRRPSGGRDLVSERDTGYDVEVRRPR